MSNLQYQSGFANEFATEAVAGALPKGQNSPRSRPSDSIPSSSAEPLLLPLGPPAAAPGSTASAPR